MTAFNPPLHWLTSSSESVAYLGGAMRPCPPPRKVRKHFLTRYTVKNGISNLYILLKLKVPSKCRKCRFRDPNFKKIFGGACPQTPLQLCRHYGLPLTKILATPLFWILYDLYMLKTSILRSWISSRLPPSFVCDQCFVFEFLVFFVLRFL